MEFSSMTREQKLAAIDEIDDVALAEIHLTNLVTNEELQLPMIPKEIKAKTATSFRSFNVIERGEVKIPRGEELSSFTWTGIFPGARMLIYPYVDAVKWQEPKEFISTLTRWRENGEKIRLLITQTSINHDVYLKSFDTEYSGAQGNVEYTVNFIVAKELKILTVAEADAQAASKTATLGISTEIADTINNAANSITSAINDVTKFIDNITSTISDIAKKIGDAIDGVVSNITGFIGGITSAINSVTSAVQNIVSSISGAINRVMSSVAGVIGSVTSAVTSITRAVSNIRSSIDSVRTSINGIGSSFRGISADLSNVTRNISSMTDRIEAVADLAITINDNIESVATVSNVDAVQLKARPASAVPTDGPNSTQIENIWGVAQKIFGDGSYSRCEELGNAMNLDDLTTVVVHDAMQTATKLWAN